MKKAVVVGQIKVKCVDCGGEWMDTFEPEEVVCDGCHEERMEQAWEPIQGNDFRGDSEW